MELVMKDAKSALEVSETTFGREFNEALVHQVVVAYAAGARQGIVARRGRVGRGRRRADVEVAAIRVIEHREAGGREAALTR